MMDILLTYPVKNWVYKSQFITEKLGILYIAAYLDKEGYSVKIIDPDTGTYGFKDIVSFIKNNKPRAIGISAFSSEVYFVHKIARAIRGVCDSKIILGGVHGTLMPEDTLNAIPEIDFIVINEGEITIHELMKSIDGNGDFKEIKGIAYRDGSDIYINEPQPFISDLDSIPLPARHLTDMEKYSLPSIMGKRGCPRNCFYCSSPRTSRRRVRFRSPENVLEEVGILYSKYNKRFIKFRDDDFTVNKKWAVDVCEGLIRKGYSDLKFDCNCRVDSVDYEMLKLLRRAGCEKIIFGVESGSQNSLNKMNKKTTLQQGEDAIRLTKKAGIATYANFILGFPWETKKHLWETAKYANSLSSNYVKFYFATPYPGTKFYEVALENKLMSPFSLSQFENGQPYMHAYGKQVYKPTEIPKKFLLRFIFCCNLFFNAKTFVSNVKREIRNKNLRFVMKAVVVYIKYLVEFLRSSGK